MNIKIYFRCGKMTHFFALNSKIQSVQKLTLKKFLMNYRKILYGNREQKLVKKLEYALPL